MSNRKDRFNDAYSSNWSFREYEVGYGKPPTSTQFQKGKSGNPKGRPRGSKNNQLGIQEESLKSIIMAEAYRPVTVREGEKTFPIPTVQAVFRSISVKAIKGNHRSQWLFQKVVGVIEATESQINEKYFENAVEYNAQAEDELARRKYLGITGPDITPHPDHIKFDYNKRTVSVHGPRNRKEKIRADEIIASIPKLEKEIKSFTRILRRKLREKDRKFYEKELEHSKSLLKMARAISRNTPPP